VKRILIVDDDVAVTNYFMVFLMQTGIFEPTVINDPREVEPLLARERFDALMLDLDMPDVSGMDILDMMAAKGLSTPVLILTGVNDVELAVRSMKKGAFDYLTKPVDDEQLLESLDAAIEHGALHSSLNSMPEELTTRDLSFEAAFDSFHTRDPVMIRLFHQAEKMAAGDLCIFIWGERGAGKEALARAIHAASPRVDRPFIAVDSGASPPGEFSQELFGRVRDWSGRSEGKPGFLEAASGGTLYLDHIEHLSLPVQVRLRRVLQTREYYRDSSTEILKADVRFIVTTTQDLTSARYSEAFSRDLLYHLMVNSIRIPPLRDRACDIPLLAQSFLETENGRTGKSIRGFSAELLSLFTTYSFPDNLQELRNIVASAVVNTEGDMITPESLSPYIRQRLMPGEAEGSFVPLTLMQAMADQVERTLVFCGGDRKQAARLLDITVSRMGELIEEMKGNH
jgi:DNA-binding NtrC family response regulator